MTNRPMLLRIVGVIFIMGALWIAVSGVSNYAQQLEQQDWVIRMAVVTEVSQRTESSGVRHSSRKTVYDVTYEYNDTSDTYTGTITGTGTKWEVGDRFDVKCDPDAPENATHLLEPQTDALIVNLAGACLFGVMGLWTAGLLPVPKRTEPL